MIPAIYLKLSNNLGKQHTILDLTVFDKGLNNPVQTGTVWT